MPGVPSAELLCLPFIISSPSLSTSLSIYLSIYLCISPFQPRSNPPLLPHHTSTPHPCCLLPSAVSEFPRVRQRETITLRRIRSPPISPCLLLPGSLCLSSSPSSSTFLFPRRQHAAFLFFSLQPEYGFLCMSPFTPAQVT